MQRLVPIHDKWMAPFRPRNMEVAAILDSVNDFFVDRELTEEQAKSIEAASSRPSAKVRTRVLSSRKGK